MVCCEVLCHPQGGSEGALCPVRHSAQLLLHSLWGVPVVSPLPWPHQGRQRPSSLHHVYPPSRVSDVCRVDLGARPHRAYFFELMLRQHARLHHPFPGVELLAIVLPHELLPQSEEAYQALHVAARCPTNAGVYARSVVQQTLASAHLLCGRDGVACPRHAPLPHVLDPRHRLGRLTVSGEHLHQHSKDLGERRRFQRLWVVVEFVPRPLLTRLPHLAVLVRVPLACWDEVGLLELPDGALHFPYICRHRQQLCLRRFRLVPRQTLEPVLIVHALAAPRAQILHPPQVGEAERHYS